MDKRLKWLRKRGLVDQVPPEIPSGSLKTAALAHIFKEASHDELLDLQKYVQRQLHERGTDVKVVLSTYNNDFARRCTYQLVYVTAIQPIIPEYVAINYPAITEAQRSNVAEFIFEAIKPQLAKRITMSDSQIFEKYGMSIEKLARVHDGFRITLSSIEEPVGDGPVSYEKWRKYMSMSITNPYLISAVEQLRTEGVEIPKLILTTIRVPYGKVMKEHFDSHYGDYVEFVDESDDSDSSSDEEILNDDYGGYYRMQ